MGRMAEQQRKLLEQMMGPEAMGLFQQHVDWWDPKVCRNFLCGTCPHDVFGNTKMDLGPCPKMHSEKVATAFKAAREANPSDPRFAAFEQEYQNNLYAFIEDCDRKIRMSQRRLEKTPEENAKGVNLMREIGEIELAIQSETEEVESLGEAGKVEESMKKLEAVEALKAEKTEKEKEMQRLTETGGASGHQKLRVCETCGAYLSILDSDRRLADHFGGKMHLGYHDLRKLLEGFAAQRQARLAAGPPPGAVPGPNGPPGAGYRPGPPHMNGGGGLGYLPNGHAAPPPSAPSAPRGPAAMHPPSGPGMGPSTPRHSAEQDAANLVDAVLSSVPGHGDKRKREAVELAGDVKSERSRDDDRERRRHRSRDRDERHRSSDREYRDRDRERDRDGRSSRYDDDRRESRSRHDDKYYDRDRGSRSERSDRDRERDRDRDRDRTRDDKPRRDRDRSRSPRK